MSEVDKSPLHYKLGREQLRGKRLSIRILVFFVLELSHFFFSIQAGIFISVILATIIKFSFLT